MLPFEIYRGGEYSGISEWVEGRAYKERYCLCYLLKFIRGGVFGY